MPVVKNSHQPQPYKYHALEGVGCRLEGLGLGFQVLGPMACKDLGFRR